MQGCPRVAEMEIHRACELEPDNAHSRAASSGESDGAVRQLLQMLARHNRAQARPPLLHLQLGSENKTCDGADTTAEENPTAAAAGERGTASGVSESTLAILSHTV